MKKQKKERSLLDRAKLIRGRSMGMLAAAAMVLTAGTGPWMAAADARGIQSDTTSVEGQTADAPGPVDLVVDMTVSNSEPSVGDEVSYSVTVANTGVGVATGVIIEDVLAPPLTLARVTTIDGQVVFDDSNRAVRWMIGELAPAASASLVFAVIIGDGFADPITNSAVASSTADEANQADNVASATIKPLEPAEPVAGSEVAVDATGASTPSSEAPLGTNTDPLNASGSTSLTAPPLSGDTDDEGIADGSDVPLSPSESVSTGVEQAESAAPMVAADASGPVAEAASLGSPPESLAFAGSRSEFVASVTLVCVMAALVAIGSARRSPALATAYIKARRHPSHK